MEKLVIWFINNVLQTKAVMVVDVDGKQRVRRLQHTDSGKAYVLVKSGVIGFLDNVTQQEGEFRKGISSDTLRRWFYVS